MTETDNRFQTPIPSKDELKQLFQTFIFALKLRSQLVTQTALGLAVTALVALSGSVTAATVNPAQEAAQASLASTTATTLDDVSSANIAAAVAVTTDAIVAAEVVELATTLDTEVALATDSDTNILAKPAIPETDEKTIDDTSIHQVKKGESLAEIAKHYGISVDTIKWANKLSGNSVNPGAKLKIPAVNGVFYTVKDGDTPETLAATYNTTAHQIITFNDAELSGLKAGQKILIPGGEKPEISSPKRFAGSYGASSHADHYSEGPYCGSSDSKSLGRVKRGQVIGYMGTTGASSGTHLHIGMCNKLGGYAFDPVASSTAECPRRGAGLRLATNCRLKHGFSWPLRDKTRYISRGYWGAGHAGLDIDTYPVGGNPPILAVGDGEIIGRGYMGSGGNAVIIKHDNGIITHYLHLSSIAY